MLVEERAERRFGIGVLREHASARYLADVGRLQMDLLREAVHKAGKLDLLVVETADQLAQLLLGGDDEPVLAATDAAEALYDRGEVQHLLDVTGDELAHLVNNEQQGLPGAAALHQ